MEPVRPQKRKAANSNKLLFNKGYTPWNKGKTFEELFGVEGAKVMKARQHPFGRKKKVSPIGVNGKPLVIIEHGRVIARFPSACEAGRRTGIPHQTISRYCMHRFADKERGWLWFYEKDIDVWSQLLNP